MLLQCLFAFGAIITFSVIIEAPRKCLLVNGILGLAGWAIYLYTEQFTSVLMATFMSGLVLAIISHILARLLKTPVTTTLIPAILTIVPGAGMEPYKILEIVIQKNTSVRTDPQRWIFAKRGMPNCTISLRSGLALPAHCNATARVAAEDMVPTAVR